MCGIAGFFHSREKSPVDGALLRRMTDSLVHRGPDDSGFYEAPGIGLGHRRLSIIDVAGGQQPQFNEDRTVVTVYNGEVYNFQELTRELEALGHRFSTHGDTEVIVHGWEEWGPGVVDHLRGMFAFALWDENQQTLFLARDRLGIKPLHYSFLADGTLLFGSELKALLQHPRLPKEIDPQAVEDYFAFGYIPDPKTIYRDVHKLAPGHILTLRRGESAPRVRQYWDIAFEPNHAISETEAMAELEERLREAVEIRMISEVPLGAFLSGGVDSSSVVAFMADKSDEPINTCSIGFGVADFDESRYAEQVARHFSTRHHNQQVKPDSFDLMDQLAGFYDEPFADSSAMPTYQVCRLARERVTVALSGDGGDETFAGYRRYRWHGYEERVRQRLPQALRGPLFGLAGRIYPKLDWAPKRLRAKSTFQALARDSAAAYFHSVSTLSDSLRRQLYSDRLHADLQGYDARHLLESIMNNAPAETPLDKAIYADFKTYLPGDILTKVDRTSMANSLEVRVPILDHHLVEWAAQLPLSLRLAGHEGKYVLKKAMEKHLPHEILYRDKMGFAVPLAKWFRGPLKDRTRKQLLEGQLAETGLFDIGFVAKLLETHASGISDHSTAIWTLAMFESFLRKTEGGGDIEDSPPTKAPAETATQGAC
jgi:asparagine synthase (glutamine-hydrolysing)